MRTYNCIIVEDQLPAQRILQRYIEKLPELQLVESFTDPLKALAFMRKTTISILFLDIHLPSLTGMELLKILPYQPKIILTTAFSEYALDGYEFDVADYLLKPISLDRFIKAVSRVIASLESSSVANVQSIASTVSTDPDFVFMKSDRMIIKIECQSIRYIKSEDDFTRVFMEGKNHFLSNTLKFWSDILSKNDFVRIHRSYIVNIKCIDKIVGNQVYLGEERLPIGRSFRDAFMAKIDLKV